MLTPTHLVVAQTAYLGACIADAQTPTTLGAMLALIGALIPDMDSRSSYVGRLLPPVTAWIEDQFGHRTITHSLIAQAVAGAAAWWLLPDHATLPLLAGWVSHSWADMMTPSGVCWFWPARGRCVLPGGVRYRIDLMSRAEWGFMVVMAAVGALLMPFADQGAGVAGLIRSAIGDVADARRQYDAGKGGHAYRLIVRGRDNTRFVDVSGTYDIIGPFAASGFILATPDGPRSICASPACDWYADHAEIRPGAAEETTTQHLSARLTSTTALLRAVAPLEDAGKVYISGQLTARGLAPLPPTITTTGDQVTLAYASPDAIAQWGDRPIRSVELDVQVRHARGEGVPPVALDDTPPPLSPLLQAWIDRSR